MNFKKQIFGFLDMLRFKKMALKRRSVFEKGSSNPLPQDYKVNELSRKLHPSVQFAKLKEIRKETSDTKTFVFEPYGKTKSFAFFRAGQYITLTARFDEIIQTRPFSISSSPKQAINGIYELTIKREGKLSCYMVDKAKVGDIFELGEPWGEFYYEPARDKKHIVAIGGGSGITPFLSIAKAIEEESENFKLTIFFGSKTEKDIIQKKFFDGLKNEKIKVVHVLSNEKKEKYENGFITGDLIKKYVKDEFSVMMCGPTIMYDFLEKELAKLKIESSYIRKELNSIKSLKIEKPKSYKLTVKIRDEKYTVPCFENETLLVALEKAGIKAPNKCRSGVCGYCHSKLISGKIYVNKEDEHRREADIKFGYIHPCATFPKSDIEIDVPKAPSVPKQI